jgi:hypothetical protein
MKYLLIFFLGVSLTASAQLLVEPGQHWQVSDGAKTWVVEIVQDLGQGFFSTKLVSGELLKNHELYVSAETSRETLTFEFGFNFLLATDSGSGFSCEVKWDGTNETLSGDLVSYRTSVAGRQWSTEKESCEVRLLHAQ